MLYLLGCSFFLEMKDGVGSHLELFLSNCSKYLFFFLFRIYFSSCFSHFSLSPTYCQLIKANTFGYLAQKIFIKSVIILLNRHFKVYVMNKSKLWPSLQVFWAFVKLHRNLRLGMALKIYYILTSDFFKKNLNISATLTSWSVQRAFRNNQIPKEQAWEMAHVLYTGKCSWTLTHQFFPDSLPIFAERESSAWNLYLHSFCSILKTT